MLSTSWVRQTASGAARGHLALRTKNPSLSMEDRSSSARNSMTLDSKDGVAESLGGVPRRTEHSSSTRSAGTSSGWSEPEASPRLPSRKPAA